MHSVSKSIASCLPTKLRRRPFDAQGSSAAAAVDGAGMRGDLHEANNLGMACGCRRLRSERCVTALDARRGSVVLCQVGDKNSPVKSINPHMES